jgi:hypothetical protein
MTGTTAKGYPYPTGTDRVMDGDNAIQALAEKVESAAGTMASGVFTVSAVGNVSTNITFPVGRFVTPPNITATATAGASTANPCLVAVNTGPTASGAAISANRASGAAYQVYWVAHSG